MRRPLFLLVLSAALLPAAPSAEEILAKTRAAIGRVDNLQSLSITGTRRIAVDSPDGSARTMSREVEIDMLLPDKYIKAEVMELPNGMEGPTIYEALDGATSWRDMRNMPTGGNIVIRTMPPPGSNDTNADEIRTRNYRGNYLRTLLLYTLTAPAGVQLKYDVIGEAEAPEGKAWILDITGPDRFALRLYIDQKSNLPVMASWRALQQPKPMMRTMMGPGGHGPGGPGGPGGAGLEGKLPEPPKPKEVEFEARFSERVVFQGVHLPKVTSLSAEGQLAEEFEIKTAKINPKIKPEKFRK